MEEEEQLRFGVLMELITGGPKGPPMPSAGARMRGVAVTQNLGAQRAPKRLWKR